MKRFMVFLCVLFLFFTITTPSSAETPYLIEQITFVGVDDYEWFQMNETGDVVFYASDGEDDEIFLYDGSTKLTSRVTDNSLSDRNPDINANGDIAWQSFDIGNTLYSNDIYVLYDGSTVPLHIEQSYDDRRRDDASPQINDSGVIVWSARVSGSNLASSEIFKYDGSLTRLTNNDYADQQVSISSNGDIVWNFDVGGTNEEIWLNDPSASGNISNSTLVDNYPVINSNGDIVWGGAHLSPDIFLYNGVSGTVTNLTSDTTGDGWPDINDNGDVVWTRGMDIVLYDSTTQLVSVLVTAEFGDLWTVHNNESGDMVWVETGADDEGDYLYYLIFYDGFTEELTVLDTCYGGYPYYEINGEGDVAWLDDEPGFYGVSSLYVATQVPVPAAVWLFGSGILSIVGIRRKYKK